MEKSDPAGIAATDLNNSDVYCALTVSPSARAAVHTYIARQEEHHRKQTFQEELVEVLEKAEIAYDPRYLH